MLVSEWLWADAFTIAFHSRNFLFSSQKKWCPPFPSCASNTNTITLSLIAMFLWLGKAASQKWTQTHPTINSGMQIPPDSTEGLCSTCKCSWLCCPAQICQLPLSDSRYNQQNWVAQELALQGKAGSKMDQFYCFRKFISVQFFPSRPISQRDINCNGTGSVIHFFIRWAGSSPCGMGEIGELWALWRVICHSVLGNLHKHP